MIYLFFPPAHKFVFSGNLKWAPH